METIIFVCTGNTCRSPMAEGLFRAHNGEEKTGFNGGFCRIIHRKRPSGFRERGMPQPENAARIFRRTARTS